MYLVEKVKEFLKKSTKDEQDPNIPEESIIDNFSDDGNITTGAFFDDEYNTVFSARDKHSLLEAQKNKIMLYRSLSKTEEVHEAIDEIINEIVYTEKGSPLKVQLNEENDKIGSAIEDAFTKILNLMKIEKSFYGMVRQSYIDGQIIIHCEYSEKLTDGIKQIRMLEPLHFYFDKKSEMYKYSTKDKSFFTSHNLKNNVQFQKEEIIKETFGLHEGEINLSYLEYAIKSSNRLKILEDLLIPLRFSRSISRRVFNVDTGELSNSKSLQAMDDIQKKFRYKKFYNTDTGEITNQQHITSMVEDYWFANRSGGKGTTVDLLDETGNLGEVNDLLYFQKKLYKSLKIPQNRISGNSDADSTFDYDSTSVTHDDMKFFMFISRIRKVYIAVFKELLKRELVSTGVMTIDDYTEYENKIKVIFASEAIFLERMKLDNLSKKLELYSTVQEYNGKLFPVQTILSDVFNLTADEIESNFKEIEKEKKDPKFKSFYESGDDY